MPSLGGGTASYGLLFGAVFIGLGLGIAIGPSVARDLSRERLFGVALVGAGVPVLLLAWTFALWIALLLVVLMGFFAGVAYLACFTLLGTEIEDEDGEVFILDLTDDDIDRALDAAAAVGDDRIQQRSGGRVNPEAWTHGSADARKYWFRTGRDQGTLRACDTFAVDDLHL